MKKNRFAKRRRCVKFVSWSEALCFSANRTVHEFWRKNPPADYSKVI